MKFPIYKLKITDTDTETGVEFVALVDQPAIEKNFVAFDSIKQMFQIKDAEKRIVSGALMVANLPIYRRDEQYGEYYVVFDKETIAQIVHKFFKNKNSSNVNLMHDANQKVEDVYMFESFIIDKASGRTAPHGFENLSDGSWFGSFKVNNDKVWEQIKAGEFKGFSVEGIFQHEFIYDSETLFIDRLREVLLRELNKSNNDVILLKDQAMKLNIDDKLKTAMAAIKAAFTDEVIVEMTDAKLADGVTIVSYEGKTPVAGANIFVVDETGKNPAPDGEHTLEDGTVISVSGGVIMDVKPAEVEVETKAEEVVAPVNNEAIENLTKELEEIKASIVELKSANELEIKKLSETNKALFAVIEQMANIPDAEPTKKPVSPFSKTEDKNKRIIELSKALSTIKNK